MVATIKFSQFAAANLTNTSNKIVGVSALSGGTNFYMDDPLTWSTATRPSSPPPGTLGYNLSLGQYEYWNGASWIQFAAGGSGTVNLGSQYQLAYYANTGTAVSGLFSANNAILNTNSSGIPSWNAASASTILTANSSSVVGWSSTLPAGLTLPQPNIVGVIDGSDAVAGSVGEFMLNQVLMGSAVSLTTATPVNLCQISLTAGDWDVWGNTFCDTTGTVHGITVSLSSVSLTNPDQSLVNQVNGSTLDSNYGVIAPSQRFNVTTTTPVYLVVNASFSSGAVTASGGIFARRRR